MKTLGIVVVGHVDHGKTSLVHALTGMETDRLPEEKARSLSIVAGFAHQTYPEGIIDFIDAPGHADFIPAMAAAAAAAQAVLVVVSATESMRAQTYEHLAITEMLEINSGVIAVTKSDLLDPTERAKRLAEIKATFADTSLTNARVVLCSAQDGSGMDDLNSALQTLLAKPQTRAVVLVPMLPIDRVFTLAGHGTIVTGTLLGGDLAIDTAVTIEPSGLSATVRRLQSHGIQRAQVHAGERVAVNLRGIAVEEITRGSVLRTPSTGSASTCIDVRIKLLTTSSNALKHMQRVRVLFGTAHAVATVRLYSAGNARAEQTGFAQLRFEKPVFGYEGQRAVLRRLSPPETIGSAEFLNTHATPTRSGAHRRLHLLHAVDAGAPLAIAAALCEENEGVACLNDAARLSRIDTATARKVFEGTFENLSGDVIAAREGLTATTAALLDALAAYHANFPLRLWAPRAVIALPDVAAALIAHVLTSLVQAGQVQQHHNGLALRDHDPLAALTLVQRAATAEIEAAFRKAGLTFQPAIDATFDPNLITLLIDTGRIISLHNISLNQTLLFHRDSLSAAATQLGIAFPTDIFTTSQAREALGTSRKIIVPVLEYFDETDVTLRTGDARRIAGKIPVPPPAPPC